MKRRAGSFFPADKRQEWRTPVNPPYYDKNGGEGRDPGEPAYFFLAAR
jgi:hypothetical protein